MNRNRKPHLLRAKQEIVAVVDSYIDRRKRELDMTERCNQRDLAILISQRNRLARDADLQEIPLTEKDGQGNLLYIPR